MKQVCLTADDVKHIAKLANLSLAADDLERFAKQLAETLGYIQKLAEVQTADVAPTAQITGLTNVFRQDEVKPSLSQEEALANAADSHNGYFKVRAIFDK